MQVLLGVLVGGLIVGVLVWFIAQFKFKSEASGVASQLELDNKYVSKDIHIRVEKELEETKLSLQHRDEKILNLIKENSSLNQRLTGTIKELDEMHKRLTTEFENIANRVLKHKSDEFLKVSHSNIDNVLGPLKDNIKTFKEKVEYAYDIENRERASLKTEIKYLRDLNQQLSQDANNLANALKGEAKTQGNWGEMQLERILERLGLEKETHYRMQQSFFDTDKGGYVYPDCIINLPDKKHLVIDSKVSLVAYEQYFNAGTEEDREKYLKSHLESIISHIKDLSSKNYQNIYQINSPDYVFMFIPIEGAFSLALRNNVTLFDNALNKNIILVTASSLVISLRTVAAIWKQEDQKKNALKIARESGALYDKFVGFIEDLKKVEVSLDQAKLSHNDAMNKLITSKKKGDTLVGRIERIKTLGAKAAKSIPQDILEEVMLDEEMSKTAQIESGQEQELNI
ncbi:MAG: DNA recombination protein RmuC [Candidatus Omnitrophota bacterium]